MIRQTITNSTILMRVMCAVVFFIFAFCYLYFYQADIIAMAQHVLSDGQTRYEPLIGAVLLTISLSLLQLLVFAITRLYKRAHAFTYFPSMLALLLLTCARPSAGWHLCCWCVLRGRHGNSISISHTNQR